MPDKESSRGGRERERGINDSCMIVSSDGFDD